MANAYGNVASQTAGVQILPIKNKNELLVVIRPPDYPTEEHPCKRTPCQMVLILDNSSSMNEKAWYPGMDMTNSAPTKFELANQAVRMVIDNADDEDMVAILTTEPVPSISQTFQQTTNATKHKLRSDVGEILISKSDLSGAIERGMNMFRNADGGKRNKVMYIFSDGLSLPDMHVGCNPEINSMLRWIGMHHPKAPTVSTFGFGHDCRWDSLYQFSRAGRGVHSFIPDETSIRAAMVPALADAHCTFAVSAELQIDWAAGKVYSAYEHLEPDYLVKDDTMIIKLGCMQYGQARTIFLACSESPSGKFEVHLSCQLVDGELKTARTKKNLSQRTPRMENGALVNFHLYRSALCDLTESLITSSGRVEPQTRAFFHGRLSHLVQDVSESPFRTHPLNCSCNFRECIRPLTHDIDGLYQDLAGSFPNGSIARCMVESDRDTPEVLFHRQSLPSILTSHAQERCSSLVLSGPLRRAIESGVMWIHEAGEAMKKLPDTNLPTNIMNSTKIVDLDRWR